jgi:GNAT superfamily N-acetyltransferase
VVPLAEHFDVAVIGGGPAGYAAALYGAGAGLRIALVEKNKVGGTCLHVGCIPAKELLETATVYRQVSAAGEFGVQAGEPSLDLSVSHDRKQKVIDRLFKGLQGTLKGRKVDVYDGHGRLHADRRVTVTGEDGAETAELTADAVFLAPGSVPRTIPGFVLARLALSEDLHGQGRGGELLAGAVGMTLAAIRLGGGRVIVVDAIDDRAAAFYEHFGFRPIPANPHRFVMKASTAAASLSIDWP